MKLVCLFIAALLATFGALAKGTYAISDAQSQVLDTQLPLKWRSISPAKGDHTVEGTTRVQIKLDTQAWVGQSARIYMALPAQSGSTIVARWVTQNSILQNGQLNSGQRALVWSGVVQTNMLEDVFTVTIQTDGRLLSASQMLRFYFEMDVQ
jgi:hypothetical protein